MLKRLAGMAVALSVILPSSPALADSLRFALSNWAPFSFNEDGKFDGIDLDVAREIARRAGFDLIVRPCPFKRCLKEMELGRMDMQSGIARNPEREAYLAYAETPYHAVSVAFHVRRGEANRLTRYEDLYGLRVGAVVKSHYFDRFNQDGKLTKFEVNREDMLLPMLDLGRIDAYVGTNPNAAYDILQRGYKGRFEEAAYSPGVEVPIYFALSRKSKHIGLLPAIDQAIRDIRADGSMDRILAKYR